MLEEKSASRAQANLSVGDDRLWLGDHSSLLVAVALLAAGCLIYFAPFLPNISDLRPLIAGAAFGGALTEFINDLHKAEDRREQRKAQLLQELRHSELRSQNERLQIQYDMLQKDSKYLRARNPDLHPCEHAVRLGSCVAQMHLLGHLRARAHLARSSNIRSIAKLLDVQDQFDKAKASLERGKKLDRDQWRELLSEIGTDLRRLEGPGAQEAFLIGYKLEKMAIRLKAPVKSPDSDEMQTLLAAVDVYGLAEPFRSWALSNLDAAFAKTANVGNSQVFLRLYASMLSFSHYLREPIEPKAVANDRDASDLTDAELFARADSRLRFGKWGNLPIRGFFDRVVTTFPNMQLAELTYMENILIPLGSDPQAYVY